MLAIDALQQHGPPSWEAVDGFMARHAFPLVERSTVTFVYRGEAEWVNLRHWVFGLPSSQPLRRVEHTDLWYHVLELPYGSRVEYKFEVGRHGHGEWMADPRNPNHAHDPFGYNSVCHGEGYTTPPWIEPDPEARPGTLEEWTLNDTPFGGSRRVTIYRPARFRESRRYPVMVVHDGGDYLRFAALQTVLDNLIHRLEVALTHPGDRLKEYADDARHAAFLADHLLPELERRLPLFGTPRSRGLMGASFGAVASLAAAWRRPGVFGNLLLQSGSLAFTDIGQNRRGPLFDPVVAFVNAFRDAPGQPTSRVYMSCGTYESLIYENRSMAPFLQRAGMDVRFTEARDGHNWENWRDRLREGLSWVFPGPLWMVYE